jgi:hypothetical protein
MGTCHASELQYETLARFREKRQISGEQEAKERGIKGTTKERARSEPGIAPSADKPLRLVNDLPIPDPRFLFPLPCPLSAALFSRFAPKQELPARQAAWRPRAGRGRRHPSPRECLQTRLPERYSGSSDGA